MKGITYVSKGKWAGYYRSVYRPKGVTNDNGKQRCHTNYSKNKEELVALRTKIDSQYNILPKTAKGVITVARVLDDYKAFLERTGKAQGTIISLRTLYRGLAVSKAIQLIDSVALLEMDKVRAFIAECMEKGFTKNTIDLRLRILQCAIKRAKIKNTIAEYGIELGKIKRGRMTILSPEQLQLLFDNLANENQKKIFLFLLCSGVRVSQAITLTGDCIQGNYIRYKAKNVKCQGENGEDHIAPLPPLPFNLPDSGSVFKYKNRDTVLKAINEACKKAKIPKICVHDLRHLFCMYHLLNGTKSNIELKECCAWSNVSSMIDHYTKEVKSVSQYKGLNWIPAWTEKENIDYKVSRMVARFGEVHQKLIEVSREVARIGGGEMVSRLGKVIQQHVDAIKAEADNTVLLFLERRRHCPGAASAWYLSSQCRPAPADLPTHL